MLNIIGQPRQKLSPQGMLLQLLQQLELTTKRQYQVLVKMEATRTHIDGGHAKWNNHSERV